MLDKKFQEELLAAIEPHIQEWQPKIAEALQVPESEVPALMRRMDKFKWDGDRNRCRPTKFQKWIMAKFPNREAKIHIQIGDAHYSIIDNPISLIQFRRNVCRTKSQFSKELTLAWRE